MPLIEWSDRYSVGIPSLDNQHRQLIAVVNELHQALSESRAKEGLNALIAKLGQYAATHLQHEERLLQSSGYPDFARHKAEHDRYLANVKEFEQKLARGGSAVAITLAQFLREWWLNHILKVDRGYSEHLVSRKVA